MDAYGFEELTMVDHTSAGWAEAEAKSNQIAALYHVVDRAYYCVYTYHFVLSQLELTSWHHPNHQRKIYFRKRKRRPHHLPDGSALRPPSLKKQAISFSRRPINSRSTGSLLRQEMRLQKRLNAGRRLTRRMTRRMPGGMLQRRTSRPIIRIVCISSCISTCRGYMVPC